jgi:hypothetical protein
MTGFDQFQFTNAALANLNGLSSPKLGSENQFVYDTNSFRQFGGMNNNLNQHGQQQSQTNRDVLSHLNNISAVYTHQTDSNSQLVRSDTTL